jgi:hypothetical protein
MMRLPNRWISASLRVTFLALAIGALAVTPSLANTTMTQTIIDGTRSADLSSLTFDPLNYSNTDQLSTGMMTLTASDNTGTGAGWNITIQSSDFAYSGDYEGSAIPAANASVNTPGTPELASGQAISAEEGPYAGLGGSLDTPRKVIFAGEGGGKGTYTQELPVQLTVPGGSLVGTYTSTITVTMSAGPGS